ncbi:MAG: hypothetical protein ACE366_06205 [Bradymonadia bacterium]
MHSGASKGPQLTVWRITASEAKRLARDVMLSNILNFLFNILVWVIVKVVQAAILFLPLFTLYVILIVLFSDTDRTVALKLGRDLPPSTMEANLKAMTGPLYPLARFILWGIIVGLAYSFIAAFVRAIRGSGPHEDATASDVPQEQPNKLDSGL